MASFVLVPGTGGISWYWHLAQAQQQAGYLTFELARRGFAFHGERARLLVDLHRQDFCGKLNFITKMVTVVGWLRDQTQKQPVPRRYAPST